jgi:hypothetical protein
MKITAIFLVIALSTAGWAQSAPLQPAQAEDPSVKKARVLLDQVIQALGGPAYLNVQDMEQSGRTYPFYHGTPNGLGALYWLFTKWPDKSRVELTKQRDVVFIINVDQGWEITYKGTRAQDPDDLKESLRNRHYSLDHVLREWLNQPGVALFYEGSGITDQKQVEKVTIMNTQNEAVTLDINIFNHLPVRKRYQIRDPQSRQFDEDAEIYDNWRPVQGVMTPHSVTFFHNDEMVRQRFIQAVSYNSGIPDSKFTAVVTYDPTKKKPR